MNKRILSRLLPTKLYLHLKHIDFKYRYPNKYREIQRKRKMGGNNNYQFTSFDEYKCIFIHIPKCAGVAFSKSLFGNLGGGHTTLDQYIYVFEPSKLLTYFKFTVVRNPLDRLYSAYAFLKKGGFGPIDKMWAKKNLSYYKDFNDFVVSWLNRENIWSFNHFKPQYHFITERYNKVAVDYIAYFENIEKEFTYLKKRLGIYSATLQKLNQGTDRDYLSYYTDESINIAKNVYYEDFKLLNYSLD